ncbi:maleylpyruvate isomerase family mycothiol-dependent enzyme [Streptomyces decoyicus]|uniref:maleylpyruvate isomerase family mycothiol-dependent enzyme n=1 Tax=Streptomyces decoyicus TaxID=249567 RepID=UPI00386B7231
MNSGKDHDTNSGVDRDTNSGTDRDMNSDRDRDTNTGTDHDANSAMDYDGHCAEIVHQADLLASCLTEQATDLTTTVPSCPDWNLAQLLRHLGETHRWVEDLVRTRATEPPPDTALRVLPRDTDRPPAEVAAWLTEGARLLADTLRSSGPDAEIWTPLPSGSPRFFARRMAHETVMHRADATLTLGRAFTIDRRVALDTLDEWMELGSLPEMFDYHPDRRELLGPGRTLHFHATDTPPEAAADWIVDLTGDTLAWRRAQEPASVSVRAPLTDLLLLIYGRVPADNDTFEITGDAELLEFWLARVLFG